MKAPTHTNNQMTRRQNNFRAKYGNNENETEKLIGKATWEKS